MKKKRKLSWHKGAAAGEYVAGDFKISGAGTSWTLTRISTNEVLAEGVRSKRLAQDLADDEPAKPQAYRPQPEQPHRTGDVELLKINMGSMDMAIRELSSQVGFLREAVDRLTEKLNKLG